MSNIINLLKPKKPIKRFDIIAAVSMNGVIGNSETNDIPWTLRLDFKWFKDCTTQKTVIMGSRTFDSIGKPLPKRRNVVLTRDIMKSFALDAQGVDYVYGNLQAAIENEEDIFVIGGQYVYEQAFLLHPSRLFITIVNKQAVGDVKFPISGDHFLDDVVEYGDNRYECKYRSEWHTENGIEFQFTRFERD